MKKAHLFILISCFCFGHSSRAQIVELSLRRVELGFRLMPTVSDFRMEAYEGGTIAGEATFGYGVGGLLAFNFNEHSGFQGEVIYNALSQKYVSAGISRTLNVQYLNVPVLYSLSTGKSKMVNLSLVVG